MICAGVETLIKKQGLKAKDVVLWVDWQSIYQDDKEEKMKGVRSLIKYATLCDYMLVPTEEEQLPGCGLGHSPDHIPGYGSRGWCRVEFFIFSLAAEMREREVPFYAIALDGLLTQYPIVNVKGGVWKDMPSQGALSNPNDKALVQDLEDTMIEAYVPVIVETKCKAGAGGKVKLRLIRDSHVEALCEAVNKYEVKELSLNGNQLGDAGAEAIAAMLRTNRSLTILDLRGNKIGDAGEKAARQAVEGRTGFELLAGDDKPDWMK